LLEDLPADRVRVQCGEPWSNLASELSTCSAFIGHDTGVTHLAAALGLPGVVLWADRVEQVFGPRSESMRLVRSPAGVMGITVAQVTSAIAQALSPAKTAFDISPRPTP